jgi:cytochrome bd-type quinol oxidase subunit 1
MMWNAKDIPICERAKKKSFKGVPLVVGGVPDDATKTVNYGLQIPFGLSLLVGYNPETKESGSHSPRAVTEEDILHSLRPDGTAKPPAQ